ncbi:MAG: hypothetical protein Fur0018_12700 [Anaerolineales bacterium]
MPEPQILIVDDEPGIAHLCERLLARAGFGVQAMTNPRRALELLARQTLDLLLVDIRMPGMDGFELMRMARQAQPELAVVIMTGFGTVETAIEALRLGADGLILKPFSHSRELVDSVKHALETHRQQQDAMRLRTLRPLFEVSRSLFAETDAGRLRTLLLDAVCAHLHCAHGGLYVRDGETFRLEGARGEPPSPAQAACLLTEAGEMRVWNPADMPADLPYRALVCAASGGETKPHWLLAARMDDEPPFSDADAELLDILVHQGTVALENARLYAELRSYVRQVEESRNLLVQAEKMATAGRLTASIAHEVNNPLQGMRNCLHLATRPELTPQERQEYLQLAQEELDRLMKTVQRMLDFYRPDAIERKPTDLHDVIDRVVRLLRSEMKQRNIELRLVLQEDLPSPWVVRDQIQQVVLNLALNAIEAMPQGGTLCIETRYNQDAVILQVADSGPGIPSEVRTQIFEPFFSTKEHGSGLGLTVCDGIITAHGGRLELVDRPAWGACFQITLPRHMPAGEH